VEPAALKLLICVAAADIFGLPFDPDAGPPPQLPALTRYEPPVFPPSLRVTSISDGYVSMMFTVATDGQVEDSVAIDASHPAFARAVQDALSQWRFVAAAGATTPRREYIQFDFKRTGTVSALSHFDAGKSLFPPGRAAGSQPIRTVSWHALQTPPERIAAATPIYPEALRSKPVKGYAMVSFVIDADGQVRVPVVTGSSDALFGEAALGAVRQWRFAPPLHEGNTVQVIVERSFTFGSGAAR
jgi:TonB family protein